MFEILSTAALFALLLLAMVTLVTLWLAPTIAAGLVVLVTDAVVRPRVRLARTAAEIAGAASRPPPRAWLAGRPIAAGSRGPVRIVVAPTAAIGAVALAQHAPGPAAIGAAALLLLIARAMHRGDGESMDVARVAIRIGGPLLAPIALGAVAGLAGVLAGGVLAIAVVIARGWRARRSRPPEVVLA